MGNLEILGDDLLAGSLDILGDDDDDDDDDDDGDGGDEDLFGAVRLLKRRGYRVSGKASAAAMLGTQRVQLQRAKKIVALAQAAKANKLADVKMMQFGGVVRPKRYSELRKLPAGFDSTIAVPAGDTVNITITAIVPIRPDRLMIAATCAPFFSLTRLTVQLQDHMLTPEGIPCDLFTPTATAVNEEGTGFFKIPAVDVGTDIVMSFRNYDTADHFLRGAWLCTAAL